MFVWELPQNLIGLYYNIKLGSNCVCKFPFNKKTVIVSDRFHGGISLGNYIILSDYSFNDGIIDHEYGHCIQSQYLGWLYLIGIGLPSLIHCIIWSYSNDKWDYYMFYTERWANYLSSKRKC